MDDCRLHITREKDCHARQLGPKNYRRTPTGKLNVMFTSCFRPEPCPHLLSDEDLITAGGVLTLKNRRPTWGYGRPKNG